jgi:hypothetical protein
MLAYTGLETVDNLAEEARRPGVDIPRSLFGAIGVRRRHRDRRRRALGLSCVRRRDSPVNGSSPLSASSTCSARMSRLLADAARLRGLLRR